MISYMHTFNYQGDSMKKTQILIRLSQDEKNKISEKASEKGLSINAYALETLLSDDIKDDSSDNNNDIKNDINADIIAILKDQLDKKDEQIVNLQKIIFNHDTKLLDYEQKAEKKRWWNFFKSDN